MRFNPASDVRDWIDDNGNRVLHIGSIYTEYDNPLWDINKNINKDKTNRILANTNLLLTPTKWLTVTGILGADVASTEGLSVYHAQSYSGSGSAGTPRGGRLQDYNEIDRIFSGSLVVSAKHNFGNFNNVYSIGGNFQNNNFRNYSQYGENLYDPNFYSINNTDPETQLTKLNEDRFRNIGGFVQAVVGYKEYLYLTLSGRRDGASRLMPNNPYFAYPSASLSYNFSDMPGFKEKYPWITFGKLRGSLGITGKQPWRTYATKSNLEAAATTGGGFAYSYYGGNPGLKAETTKNYEFGTELQFLDNRIGFDFTYYYLLSKDQIILPRLSYGSGFVLKMMNGGDVRNEGIEVQMKANPLRKTDFNWDITFNYTQNRGKVLSIADELPELYDSDTWVLSDVRSAVHPGYSTGAISGPKFERNDKGEVLIDPSSGLPIRSSAIYQYIGDRTPKFTLGIVNNFQYKAFNLSFLWDLRYGGDVMNGTEYELYTRGISTKTLDRETPRVVNGVLKDGLENTEHPTINTIAVTPYRTSAYYTTNIEPGQFVEHNIKALRLRDITLAYTLPKHTTQSIRFIQNFKAFVTLTDVVLFTNYTGLDPESNITNPASGGIGGYGLDYGNIGRPLAINLGLSVTF
ncbi:Outer membrane protein beta-barrel family protein [bacterium A37T11]|nr:Outer membrane protein beta-barrel family protein [bacterium A37T11]